MGQIQYGTKTFCGKVSVIHVDDWTVEFKIISSDTVHQEMLDALKANKPFQIILDNQGDRETESR